MFTAIFAIFSPIIGAVTAALSIVASLFKGVAPIVEGASAFIVWYVKEFFKGVAVIIQNLSTLTVLASVIVGLGLYLHHKEGVDCRKEIEVQKKVDAARCARMRGVSKFVDAPAPIPAPVAVPQPAPASEKKATKKHKGTHDGK